MRAYFRFSDRLHTASRAFRRKFVERLFKDLHSVGAALTTCELGTNVRQRMHRAYAAFIAP